MKKILLILFVMGLIFFLWLKYYFSEESISKRQAKTWKERTELFSKQNFNYSIHLGMNSMTNAKKNKPDSVRKYPVPSLPRNEIGLYNLFQTADNKLYSYNLDLGLSSGLGDDDGELNYDYYENQLIASDTTKFTEIKLSNVDSLINEYNNIDKRFKCISIGIPNQHTNSILIKKIIEELNKSIYTSTWLVRNTKSIEIEKQKACH